MKIAKNHVNRLALDKMFDYMQVKALLVNSPKNVFYLTGSPTAIPNIHLTPWYSPSEPGWNYGIVLQTGESYLFVDVLDAEASRELAWAEIVEFDRTDETALQAALKWLAERGFDNCILGYESEALPAAAATQLRKAMPNLRLTPVDEALDLVRSQKTTGEIRAIKESARILDEAMIQAFTDSSAGSTEWDLHSSIIFNALELGAEYCRGGLMIVEDGREPHLGVGEQRFEDGDLIYADHAAFLGGYPSNQSRHAIVGQATEEQERMYAITLEVQRALIDYMRPGMSGRDVFQKCRELVAEYGMKHTAVIVGHGLGFGYQERPMITEDENMTLRDGTIIAMEPMLPPTQRYTVQDLILIREAGNVLLSDRFPVDELFVVGGQNQ